MTRLTCIAKPPRRVSPGEACNTEVSAPKPIAASEATRRADGPGVGFVPGIVSDRSLPAALGSWDRRSAPAELALGVVPTRSVAGATERRARNCFRSQPAGRARQPGSALRSCGARARYPGEYRPLQRAKRRGRWKTSEARRQDCVPPAACGHGRHPRQCSAPAELALGVAPARSVATRPNGVPGILVGPNQLTSASEEIGGPTRIRTWDWPVMSRRL
jgi:hypothetical protein